MKLTPKAGLTARPEPQADKLAENARQNFALPEQARIIKTLQTARNSQTLRHLQAAKAVITATTSAINAITPVTAPTHTAAKQFAPTAASLAHPKHKTALSATNVPVLKTARQIIPTVPRA